MLAKTKEALSLLHDKVAWSNKLAGEEAVAKTI